MKTKKNNIKTEKREPIKRPLTDKELDDIGTSINKKITPKIIVKKNIN